MDNTPKPPEGACDGWVSEFLKALLDTGKIPSATAEQIALVNREYPGARLEKNWRDVVTEVSGLVGMAQSATNVLRKAASRIELKLTGGGTSGQGRFPEKNKEAGSHERPDLPEWMTEEGKA